MRPNRSLLAAAAATVVGLSAVLAAAPASAAKSKSKHPTTTQKPAPLPGWVVDRVRVEPVDAGGEISVDGVGTYRGAIEIGRQPVSRPLVVTTTTSAAKPSRSSRRPATTTTTTSKATSTTVAAGGSVSVVNDVALDDYVKGIAEVPSTWPVEALKAQAVAARTYALHQLGRGRSLCATESCQVYAGVAKERAPSGENWAAAVEATSGQVLLYKNEPILAMYSSSDGGRTVAGSMPYLKAVKDPDDNVSPLSKWQVTIPFDVLTTVFNTPLPVLDVHRTAHDTIELIWNNDDGTTGLLDVPTAQFGLKLNSSQPKPEGLPRTIPSLRFSFVVDQEAGTLTVNGEGFGHGIGMSQFGALGKAQRGMKAADILAAYYGGIRPTKLSGAQLPATIKVTLAGSVSSPVTVSSPGHFRVVAPDGQPLATLASGSWQVVPGPKGVRVVAPAGQTDLPAVQVTSTVTTLGSPTHVRFRLSASAYVSAVAVAVGRPPVSAAPLAMDPGDHELVLPTVLGDGNWTVTVKADAGGGRVGTAPVTFDVGPPANTVPLPVVGAAVAATSDSRSTAPASAQGTGLAVGMTGLAVLTLLAAIAAFARQVQSESEKPEPRLV